MCIDWVGIMFGKIADLFARLNTILKGKAKEKRKEIHGPSESECTYKYDW